MPDITLDDSNQYALHQKFITDFNANLKIGSDATLGLIESHATYFDYVPKLDALEALLGQDQTLRWGSFSPPPHFNDLRRFFFEASLTQDWGEEERLKSLTGLDERELREKKTIEDCLKIRSAIKKDYDHIAARMVQFIQG